MAAEQPTIHYKFVYFPIKGRAEFIRYMFALAEVPYEEELVQFQDWPNRKPHVPFNTLPLLDINHGQHQINQSLAIGRYLAKRFGLAGRDSVEQAKADMYAEGWADVIPGFGKVIGHLMHGGTFEQAQEEYKSFRENTLVNYLHRYEKFLNDNPTHSGWLVGDKITWADLVVGEFLERIRTTFDHNLLDNFPVLEHFTRRVNNLPAIKAYIENRAESKV